MPFASPGSSRDVPETAAPEPTPIEAVTIDAFGTLVVLHDPVGRLCEALAERGVFRKPDAVGSAFALEADYYVGHSLRGRDEASLELLRRECVDVFLDALQAQLDPGEFVPAFVGALEFRLAEGAREALDALRGAGLALACIANWDYTLPVHLERVGVSDRFTAIVTSAEAGVEKPHPRIFRIALERLGVTPERALHIGDSPADREGAHAAGLMFEPVPLATLPQRLGLEGAT